MTITDQFLANNEAYAASFDKGGLPMPPGKRVAVLACMDARLDPARALGLEEGDARGPRLRLRGRDRPAAGGHLSSAAAVRPAAHRHEAGRRDPRVRIAHAR
jgi:hypothetical protein